MKIASKILIFVLLINFITDAKIAIIIKIFNGKTMTKDTSNQTDAPIDSTADVNNGSSIGIGQTIAHLLNNQDANATNIDPGAVSNTAPTISDNINTSPLVTEFAKSNTSDIGMNQTSPLGSNNQSSFSDMLNNPNISTPSISSILDSGKAAYVLKIISIWYVLIAIPAMTVTYHVLKALEDKGILTALYNNVKEALDSIIKLSTVCPQFIDDINRLFLCFERGW